MASNRRTLKEVVAMQNVARRLTATVTPFSKAKKAAVEQAQVGPPRRNLERRMRLWRGLARMGGLLILMRRDQLFRRRIVGAMSTMHLTLEAQKAQEDQAQNKKKTCRQRLNSFVLLPTSNISKVWDISVLLGLGWVSYRVPYLVAFNPPPTMFYVVSDIVVQVLFLMDIVLRFFSAFYDDGDLIVSLGQIASYYLRGWFLIDVIGAFPYELLSGRAIKALVLLRLLKLDGIEERLVRSLDLSLNSQYKLKFVKLIFYIAVAMHVGACAWFYTAVLEQHPDSWTELYAVADADAATQYISALYWATATLTTVGYGDISAHTNAERALAMFMILLGAVLFSLMVGKMTVVAQQLNEKEQAYKKKQSHVNQFLKFRRIPRDLRVRVRDYYVYMSRLSSLTDEKSILADLSPSLRRAITFHLNQQILTSVPVFQYGGRGFQNRVVTMLRHSICLDKEYALCAGEVVEDMTFVKVGVVQVIDLGGFELRRLETGSFFGETDILRNQRASASYRARTDCELLLLSRSDLLSVLSDFPEFEAVLLNVTKMRQADRADRRNALVNRRPVTPPPGISEWASLTGAHNDFDSRLQRMVAGSRTLQAQQYKPQPHDLSGVELPRELEPLVEELAENAHDVWSVRRFHQGWKWGATRDNAQQLHPDLVPYSMLPEESKRYDRDAVTAELKGILHAGHSIHKNGRKAGHSSDDSNSDSDGESSSSSSSSNSDQEAEGHENVEIRYTDQDGVKRMYYPRPCDTSNVKVPDMLFPLVYTLSENAHDLWARGRMDAGWRWGHHRDDAAKLHNLLLPYSFLSDEQKECNSNAVQETIAMLLVLKWTVLPPEVEEKKDEGTDLPAPDPIIAEPAPIVRRRGRVAGGGGGLPGLPGLAAMGIAGLPGLPAVAPAHASTRYSSSHSVELPADGGDSASSLPATGGAGAGRVVNFFWSSIPLPARSSKTAENAQRSIAQTSWGAALNLPIVNEAVDSFYRVAGYGGDGSAGNLSARSERTPSSTHGGNTDFAFGGRRSRRGPGGRTSASGGVSESAVLSRTNKRVMAEMRTLLRQQQRSLQVLDARCERQFDEVSVRHQSLQALLVQVASGHARMVQRIKAAVDAGALGVCPSAASIGDASSRSQSVESDPASMDAPAWMSHDPLASSGTQSASTLIAEYRSLVPGTHAQQLAPLPDAVLTQRRSPVSSC